MYVREREREREREEPCDVPGPGFPHRRTKGGKCKCTLHKMQNNSNASRIMGMEHVCVKVCQAKSRVTALRYAVTESGPKPLLGLVTDRFLHGIHQTYNRRI